MPKRKKGLYVGYLEQQKLKKELELKKHKYNIENENVVIEKNKNIILKTLILVLDVMIKVLKMILYLGIGILVTIGGTVLLNSSLREQVFSVFKLN